ncbi:hypothetical protein M1L60_25405 [Actinoplanes sp. TRM 88003]|uniref:Uncharacterized protein n=1 Tax=Paractinoplanes aksuensis TaxID=2939490 RepID=A0ABT1DVF9_9ACTN|nr:hypothetical protein [Actinoplanes aksuensis]MCO8273940.1 hypothetical protein [Actinoplanes aksuensis]
MTQLSFWGPDDQRSPEPRTGTTVTLRLLITVKAAPNPSARHGETVCVGALSVDPGRRSWIRLYPIHFRDLDDDNKFRKYDIVTVDALPAVQDQRQESWRPVVGSVRPEHHLNTGNARRDYLDPYVEDSMCQLVEHARAASSARSIALIRVHDVSSLSITRHRGWTPEQQAKINGYLSQLDILDDHDRAPLQAPRFTGAYRYRCADRRCRGHRQSLLDWEFVALQRRLGGLTDAEAADQLRTKFLDQLCGADRDVAFYVGNQAARPQAFSIGGVYAPRRPTGRHRLRLSR